MLPNSVRLLVVENHRLPILSASLSFSAGKVVDPPGKEGLGGMVAGLLTKGAGKRTAEEISAAIEGVGGSLEASAGADVLTLRGGVLSSDAGLLFELLADAVIRPAFPTKEIELLRTQTLSELQLELSQPEALADAQMMRALYGQHPYARRPTPASVRSRGFARAGPTRHAGPRRVCRPCRGRRARRPPVPRPELSHVSWPEPA